ncbi:hypothetical protein VNO77_24953 [Canavalia gladiata]|uniref:HMA domain-containing protein n=1 Tax=Canavalia gladiata TaxID=3824 RepID=A0AAN9QD68_CANGL
MGGHGGLNILPQKRWNVYNYENREKVRRDEEQAAREEQIKREQAQKRDAEFRLERLRTARGLAPSIPPSESEPKSSSDSGHINLFEGIKIFDPIEVPRKEGAAERDGPKKKKMKKEEGGSTSVVGPEDEKYRLAYGLAGKGVQLPWYLQKPNDDGVGVDDDERGSSDRKEQKGEKRKKTLEELREERLKRERKEKDRERALRQSHRGHRGHRDVYDRRSFVSGTIGHKSELDGVKSQNRNEFPVSGEVICLLCGDMTNIHAMRLVTTCCYVELITMVISSLNTLASGIDMGYSCFSIGLTIMPSKWNVAERRYLMSVEYLGVEMGWLCPPQLELGQKSGFFSFLIPDRAGSILEKFMTFRERADLNLQAYTFDLRLRSIKPKSHLVKFGCWNVPTSKGLAFFEYGTMLDNGMAINKTQICMKTTSNDNRSLLYMLNLTLPSFQVVVITANMKCNSCRGRVSRVVSKMTGLTEYTVDVHKKEVTIKGDFKAHCNFRDETFRRNTLQSANDPPKSLFTCLTLFHKH